MTDSEQGAHNPISIAVAPLNKLVGKRYYDLSSTVEVMVQLYQASAADGFELQNLAEWDARTPPRDQGERRLAAWQASEKHTVGELADTLRGAAPPILSVHANRDVGICLCSEQPQDIDRGKTLIHEALSLAGELGASVCVFHLWDTWKERFDPGLLRAVFGDIAAQYPDVKAAVENVPTHLQGHTPFALVRQFEWFTLDLRWAALYDELDRFGALADRIANVHLSGQLTGGRWTVSPRWFREGQKTFELDKAVDLLQREWHYLGPLTVEIYGQPGDTWQAVLTAMADLRHSVA
jgi:hypothetical protein